MDQISPLRRRMIEDMTVRNLSPATQHADSDDPGQGFQLKAATIPIEGGQRRPVGTFMGSQRR